MHIINIYWWQMKYHYICQAPTSTHLRLLNWSNGSCRSREGESPTDHVLSNKKAKGNFSTFKRPKRLGISVWKTNKNPIKEISNHLLFHLFFFLANSRRTSFSSIMVYLGLSLVSLVDPGGFLCFFYSTFFFVGIGPPTRDLVMKKWRFPKQGCSGESQAFFGQIFVGDCKIFPSVKCVWMI